MKISDAVKQRLQQLTDANHGRLTPAAVVKDAKNKNSPLHSYFTWDIKKAAYEHWLDQARELITTVEVEIQLDEKIVSTVCYVRDPEALPREQGYVNLLRLRDDKDLAMETIAAEFARADAALERARKIAGVLQSDVADVLTKLGAVKAKLEKLREESRSPA